MDARSEYLLVVAQATPKKLAELLSTATSIQERWLVEFFGAQRFSELRDLAMRWSSGEAARDRGTLGFGGSAPTGTVSGPLRGEVLVLPGIMGSELSLAGSNPQLLWISTVRLFLGGFEQLRLDALGANPFGSGTEVVATGYIQQTYAKLVMTLLSKGWQTEVGYYDWRKSLESSARLLDRHLHQHYGNRRVHIIAHSMGGLVARLALAYRKKREPGKHPLNGGRLIMLGTPNRGSYEIPRLFAGVNESVKTLIDSLDWRPFSDRTQIERDVSTVICSMPGVYQLMPSQDAAAEGAALYEPANYGLAKPSRRHLELATTTFRQLSSSEPEYILPDNTVYIAGDKKPTVIGIADFSKLKMSEGYRYGFDGDGTVPHKLGLLPGVTTFRIEEEHGTLPENPEVLSAVEALLENRNVTLDSMPEELVRRHVTGLDRSAINRNRSREEQDAQQAYLTRSVQREKEIAEIVAELSVDLTDMDRNSEPNSNLAVPTLIDPLLVSALGGGFLARGGSPVSSTISSGTTSRRNERKSVSIERSPEIILELVSRGIEVTTRSADQGIDALAVGHQMGAAPSGAALALDKCVTEWLMGADDADRRVLTLALRRGVFRGQLAELFFVPEITGVVPSIDRGAAGNRPEIPLIQQPNSTEHPDPLFAGRIAVLAGMGSPGKFGPPELTVLVRQLGWALALLNRKHLATVMIGARSGNLPTRDSMESWMRGLALAVRDVGTTGSPLTRITFTEYYGDRAEEIRKVMQQIGGVARCAEREGVLFRFSFDDSLKAYQGRPSSKDLTETLLNDNPVTRLSVGFDGESFRYAAQSSGAAIPERVVPLDPELVAQANDMLPTSGTRPEQAENGDFVARLMLPRDFRNLVFGADPVVLQVDATTARVHWELLAQGATDLLSVSGDAARGNLEEFLALGRGVTRQFRTTFAPVMEPAVENSQTYRILIVGDPAENMPLKGAREEAFEIGELFEGFNRNRESLGFDGRVYAKRMIGPREATRVAVLKELMLNQYDALHFAGHCFFDKERPDWSGWIFGKNEFLRAAELDRIDRVPLLVFSNACESGITPERAGQRTAALAPSFAEAFFKRGVANFICTGWPVNDIAAREFALWVYAGLLGIRLKKGPDQRLVADAYDEEPKTLELAIRTARNKLVSSGTAGGLRTWGAYQHYGNPNARIFPGPVSRIAPIDFAATPLGVSSRPQSLESTISEWQSRLRQQGALEVRPGYIMSDGVFTDKVGMIVFATPPNFTRFPAKIGKFDVQVVSATPRQQLLNMNSEFAQYLVPELDWLTPGKKAEVIPDAEFVPQEERGTITKKYVPPQDVTLDAITESMKVTCSVSPDDGFPLLQSFIHDTQERITIGMYDFSAPHILDAFKTLSSETQLKLVLGPNITRRQDELSEDVIRDELQSHFGNNFEFRWAAVKSKGRTTGSIFPTAYHIKVAVRDGRTFWLSSGNWQSSNQPPDPIQNEDQLRQAFRNHNREWHIVIENKALAHVFEQHLNNDYDQTEELQVNARGDDEEYNSPEFPDLLIPDEPVDRARRPLTLFPNQQFNFTKSKPLKVQPLLTPDNFLKHLTALVKSAKKTLYIQNQYIKVKTKMSAGFRKLLDAVKDRIDKGVDVRILLRDNDVVPMLTALLADGFPINVFRIASRTHTKGVIVDGKTVAVGSHNWSDDGVARNRDASLIFYDLEIAQFFGRVFEHDWVSRGNSRFDVPNPLIVPIDRGEPLTTPPVGYRRVSWADVFEDEE